MQECIEEAIKENRGSANLQQIYDYVLKQIQESNIKSNDYRHTIRGVLYKLVKHEILIRDDKTKVYHFPIIN